MYLERHRTSVHCSSSTSSPHSSMPPLLLARACSQPSASSSSSSSCSRWRWHLGALAVFVVALLVAFSCPEHHHTSDVPDAALSTVVWLAPFLSHSGYATEAIAIASALASLNDTHYARYRLLLGHHGDAIAEARDLPPLPLLDGRREFFDLLRVRHAAAAPPSALLVVVCHSYVQAVPRRLRACPPIDCCRRSRPRAGLPALGSRATATPMPSLVARTRPTTSAG